MPEGHTVHRIANRFNSDFAGHPVHVTSPQGRFRAGAALIDGKRLEKALAVGKQLFLFFDGDLVLRIHLGIYGKWQFHEATSSPQIIGEVRARFAGNLAIADLRGPTVCEVLQVGEIDAVMNRLGPDPLNPDKSGRDRFVDKVLESSRSIGALLMDQSVISGIGNVYRAEILFRGGISPHTVGSRLDEPALRAMWADAERLLKVGVQLGVMVTRDEFLKADPGKAERYFVYKRENTPCRNCGGSIRLEIMNGRKLYWCPVCQVR